MEKFVDKLKEIRVRAHSELNRSSLAIDNDHLELLSIKLRQYTRDTPLNVVARSNHLSMAEKISLSIMFSVVNYCYVDPKTGIDYQYSINNINYQRSSGFIKALMSSDISWDSLECIANTTRKEWIRIFHADNPDVILFDVNGRIDRLQSMANYLLQKNIDFDRFFIDYSNVDDLMNLLVGSNLYCDVFLKRLQIEVLWLQEIALSANINFAIPIKEMTVMADYRLPQILMQFNCIRIKDDEYDKLQSKLIDNQLEIALRSASIVAGEHLSLALNLPETTIDNLLWNLSQEYLRLGIMKVPAMRVETREY